jgi:hypothetical protein
VYRVTLSAAPVWWPQLDGTKYPAAVIANRSAPRGAARLLTPTSNSYRAVKPFITVWRRLPYLLD